MLYLNKSISEINISDIRTYFAYKCSSLKATSINNNISVIKNFFKWLVEEEYLAKDPTRKLKQFKVAKRLRKSLTQEELELLREACETERQKAMLEFMFTTGCRLSEIVNVRISDINWGERSLKVIGKGNKERFVYFTVKCRILLTKYINSRKDRNEFLFVSKNKPYAKLGGRTLEREIGKIAENAKINKPVFPHIIRYTMATVSLNNGMSITTVQRLLEHESPETTLIYAELNEETIKQEYKKIN